MGGRGRGHARAAMLCLLLGLLGTSAGAAPDPVTGLPPGSELDEDAPKNPREVFHSEVTQGRRTPLSSLGNLVFNSPSILGEAARRAGISCGTCHVNGAGNPRLYIPGLSSHPGTFDTTNALFDPRDDNHVLDAVTIPSLRGARLVAPYGHDGRFATLRDFARHAIVSEFSGPPPSEHLLDALVAYLEDIDFLSNPAVDAAGRLTAAATAQERRGEALFRRPFPHDPALSCASCHVPENAFVDHALHDVGSGGAYKTPTLLNADFAGRYFHDGRYDRYAQVIDHFDHVFHLGLSDGERQDLTAYLGAVGAGALPEYHLTGNNVLEDCNQFASVLSAALKDDDREVIALAVATVSAQLQDLADQYPESLGGSSAGATQRQVARAALQALIDALARIGTDAAAGRLGQAAAGYQHFRQLAEGVAPVALGAAERWSLFAQSAQTPGGARQSTQPGVGPRDP